MESFAIFLPFSRLQADLASFGVMLGACAEGGSPQLRSLADGTMPIGARRFLRLPPRRGRPSSPRPQRLQARSDIMRSFRPYANAALALQCVCVLVWVQVLVQGRVRVRVSAGVRVHGL